MLIIGHTPKRDQNEKIELKHLAGSAQLSNLADSVVGMGKSNQNQGDRYIKQLKVRSFELEYHDENVLLMNLDMLDTGLGFTIKDTANESDLVNTMVDRSERNQEIITLSYKGYSGSQIAEKLGMGKSQVNAIVKRHKDGKEE
jgi:polyhydroxyalkanoate synthesis regulator phasin